jgi:hypothetical protein
MKNPTEKNPTEARIAAHLVQSLRGVSKPPDVLKLQARLIGAAQQDVCEIPAQQLTLEDVDNLAHELSEAADHVVRQTKRTTPFALIPTIEGTFPELIFSVRTDELAGRDFLASRQEDLPPPPEPPRLMRGREIQDGVIEPDGSMHYNEGGFAYQPPPPPEHVAVRLSEVALGAMHRNQELMIRSVGQQREADARELDRLRHRIVQLEATRDELIQMREDLMDRTHSRELEMRRTLERDAWMRDSLTKVVSVLALHAPQLLEDANKKMSPEQVSILLDIVRSTGITPLKHAADAMSRGLLTGGATEEKSNGAPATYGGSTYEPPKNGNGAAAPSTTTTAGDIASTVVSDGALAVEAGGAFVFCVMVSEFLTNLRPKLVLVRGALDPTQTTQLDNILKGIDDNHKKWVPIAQAAIAKNLKTVEGAPKGVTPDAEEQKFFDLSVDFWTLIAKEPKALAKLKGAIPSKALPIVEELAQQFNFDKVQSAAATPKN